MSTIVSWARVTSATASRRVGAPAETNAAGRFQDVHNYMNVAEVAYLCPPDATTTTTCGVSLNQETFDMASNGGSGYSSMPEFKRFHIKTGTTDTPYFYMATDNGGTSSNAPDAVDIYFQVSGYIEAIHHPTPY